jgi:hypothetical protein
MPRVGDLEIDEDLTFQHRSWMVQRTGWAVMVLLLVAATLGVLGSGPLSKGTAEVPGRARVEYARFTRYQTPDTLTIHLEPAATRQPEVRLGVDRKFLDRSKIETVVPPPVRVEGIADRLVYVFAMARTGEPLTIAFVLEPQRLWLAHARLTLDAGAGEPTTLGFWQMVYP